MNREEAKKWYALFSAMDEGKTIQRRDGDSDVWLDIHDSQDLWGGAFFYRIKPKPFEMWLVLDHTGALDASWKTEFHASAYASTRPGYRVVLVREVTQP